MDTIIGIIAAIASVIAAYFTVRNDKSRIRRTIRKKQQKINELESEIFRKYRNRNGGGYGMPEQNKIDQLKQQISELEDRL